MVLETMCEWTKAMATLSYCLKDFSFYSLNLDGMSRGIIIGWKDSLELNYLSFLNTSIYTDLRSKKFEKVLYMKNLYSPYGKQNTF
jgi:hypothetical protein